MNTDNVSDIISTAHMFQINQIVMHCKDFMKDNLTEETSLTFLNLADKFNLDDLREKANEYILENFVAIRHCEDFLDIRKDALIQYLSHDELNVNMDESEAFYAAKDWLVSKPIVYDSDFLFFLSFFLSIFISFFLHTF